MARRVRILTPAEEAAADLDQVLFNQRITERAFLCYLLSRPSEMERFMGNVVMNEFFVEGGIAAFLNVWKKSSSGTGRLTLCSTPGWLQKN